MKAMSAYMTGELLLFARAFWNGALLLLIYDVIRILRGAVPHGKILTAAEDILFWIFSAFWLLGYFYRENSGVLRGYLFAGFLLGALACHFSVSRFFCQMGDGNPERLWKNTVHAVERDKKSNKKVEISDVSV